MDEQQKAMTKHITQIYTYKLIFYISLVTMLYFVYVDKFALTALAMGVMIYTDLLCKNYNITTIVSFLYSEHLVNAQKEKENAAAIDKMMEEIAREEEFNIKEFDIGNTKKENNNGEEG